MFVVTVIRLSSFFTGIKLVHDIEMDILLIKIKDLHDVFHFAERMAIL